MPTEDRYERPKETAPDTAPEQPRDVHRHVPKDWPQKSDPDRMDRLRKRILAARAKDKRSARHE